MEKIARRKIAAHIVQQLATGVAPKQLAQQAVAYLAEQRQLGQLRLLIRDIEYAAAQSGVVVASVTSAKPLSAEAHTQIEQFIAASEHAKEVIITDESVDADLLGGVIIQTPNAVFDGSVRKKLKQLQATAKE